MKTEILYEDTHLFVVRKPFGLATQTARSTEPDMVSELKKYTKGGYIGLIHRLDQPVEGLLVVARNPMTASKLNKQLQSMSLGKEYLAVVCGTLPEKEGKLLHYLKKDQNNMAVVSSEKDPLAKKAVLHYKVLGKTELSKELLSEGDLLPNGGIHTDGKVVEKGPVLSLVSVTIETGRFHQIRSQFAAIGTPLLGDRKYGTLESTLISDTLKIPFVALCANRLHLKHPQTGKEIQYETTPQNPAFTFFGGNH